MILWKTYFHQLTSVLERGTLSEKPPVTKRTWAISKFTMISSLLLNQHNQLNCPFEKVGQYFKVRYELFIINSLVDQLHLRKLHRRDFFVVVPMVWEEFQFRQADCIQSRRPLCFDHSWGIFFKDSSDMYMYKYRNMYTIYIFNIYIQHSAFLQKNWVITT